MADAGPNVAILLTPSGAAAIAVVRISGPHVAEFLSKHYSKATTIGRCVHGELSDESGNVLDDAVVVRVADEVADLNVHGGPWVIRSVLNLAERVGFELRDAADVPELAHDVRNEIEREVLVYLPKARTELALRTLLAQPDAWARFEKDPMPPREELERMLADRSLVHLLQPPRVAIVGAPNVGKSTLANQLFAQERSITADVPGTTRDWVGEIANIDGLAVVLVDTPGVRETPDAIEHEAIQRSRAEVARADLVIVVLDGTELKDAQVLDCDALVVVNKADRVQGEITHAGIKTVATTGQGIGELRDEIRRRFGCLDVDWDRPRVWTERQYGLIILAMS